MMKRSDLKKVNYVKRMLEDDIEAITDLDLDLEKTPRNLSQMVRQNIIRSWQKLFLLGTVLTAILAIFYSFSGYVAWMPVMLLLIKMGIHAIGTRILTKVCLKTKHPYVYTRLYLSSLGIMLWWFAEYYAILYYTTIYSPVWDDLYWGRVFGLFCFNFGLSLPFLFFQPHNARLYRAYETWVIAHMTQGPIPLSTLEDSIKRFQILQAEEKSTMAIPAILYSIALLLFLGLSFHYLYAPYLMRSTIEFP